jgi:hypothetical protein
MSTITQGPREYPVRALLYVAELLDLAERVAYHFENTPHPIGDEARSLLRKVRD